jgi:hypothetical protein
MIQVKSGLHISEFCTNLYEYLKAAVIFELIYLIFGKRKSFNRPWAESAQRPKIERRPGTGAQVWGWRATAQLHRAARR